MWSSSYDFLVYKKLMTSLYACRFSGANQATEEKNGGNTSADPARYLPAGATRKSCYGHRNNVGINGRELPDGGLRPNAGTLRAPQLTVRCLQEGESTVVHESALFLSPKLNSGRNQELEKAE
ncbi:hypothetical protein BDA96_08G060400 [Sorghum bicolor]|uniref:Uncharacterized protein n=1 Tax=Sorghum bicolor TaxID=4558 RepID=A0A921QED6_SORBI|nr:hypothetical protein BDA96_08G060400 [Sorghum bicolor]